MLPKTIRLFVDSWKTREIVSGKLKRNVLFEKILFAEKLLAALFSEIERDLILVRHALRVKSTRHNSVPSVC